MVSKKNKEELKRLIQQYDEASRAQAVAEERHELNLETNEVNAAANCETAWCRLQFFINHNL